MQFYTTVDLTSTNDVVQNLGHEVAYYSGNPSSKRKRKTNPVIGSPCFARQTKSLDFKTFLISNLTPWFEQYARFPGFRVRVVAAECLIAANVTHAV